MTAVSTGSEISSILLERYPEFFFLFHYARSKMGSVESSDSESKDCITFPSLTAAFRLKLDQLSTLYIYGIGDGSHYSELQEWLQNSSDRRLIFLESRLEILQQFFDSPLALLVFSDPQVVVRYLSDKEQIDLFVQQLVSEFPCERVEVLSQSAIPAEEFHQIRLELLRKSTVSHALITESLQYHKLLENILPNIRAWHGSFLASGLKGKFKNIPAVICGAGPSLHTHLSHLKGLEDKALILAGGSTITALSNNGITPHLGIAFDPNSEEFDRLKNASAYEMPLIYGTRLESNVLNTLNGERGYLVSQTGGPCESHFEQVVGFESESIGAALGMEALSVTTLLLSLAVQMGCNPILFCGVDLAYSGMQRYASGVLASSAVDEKGLDAQIRTSEKHLKKNDINGQPVSTLVKWVMESDCIASFAEKHPQVRFINVSEAGLGFKGVPNHPFSFVLESECQIPLDLRALVHAEIQQLKAPAVKESIAQEMQKIRESLTRLSQIAADYIEELKRIKKIPRPEHFPTAKLSVLGMDFEEEVAFSSLNAFVGPILDRLLNRVYTPKLGSSEGERWQLLIQREIAKFTQWHELIQKQLALF